MKKGVLTFSTIFAAVALSGCASIVSKHDYPVTITSSPDQATYEIVNTKNNMVVSQGTTPATVTLSSYRGFFSGAKYVVRFNKEGFDSQEFALTSTIDGWYFGNIIFGGLLGILIIDPATGAMWKLDKEVAVALVDAPTPMPVAAEGEAVDAEAESSLTGASATEAAPVGPSEEAGQSDAAVMPEDKPLTILTIDQVPLAMRDKMERIN